MTAFLSKCCGTSYNLRRRKQKAPKKRSFSVNTDMMKNSDFMAGRVICKMYSMPCVTLWANSRECHRVQHRLHYHFNQSKSWSSSHVQVKNKNPGPRRGPVPLGRLLAELSAEILTDCKLSVEMAGIRANSSEGGRCVGRIEWRSCDSWENSITPVKWVFSE